MKKKTTKYKIDIDDAIDRLRCMASEIIIDNQHETLKNSLQKDKELLFSLIPILNSLKCLSE